MTTSLDDVVNDIRAVLISTSGGISDQALRRDYRSLIGKEIPFRELGFSSLISFLKSVEGLKVFSNSRGEYTIDAVPDEKTGHISSLVARTRKKTKVRSRRPPSSSFRRPLRLSAPNRHSMPSVVARPKPPRFADPYRSNWELPAIIPQRQSLPDLRISVQDRLARTVSEDKPRVNGHVSPTHFSGCCSESSSSGSRLDLAVKPSVDMTKARANIVSVNSHGRGPHSATSSQKWITGGPRLPRNQQHSKTSATDRLRNITSLNSTVRPPSQHLPVQVAPPVQVAFVSNKPRMRLSVEPKKFASCVEELEYLTMKFGMGLPEYKYIERRPSREKPLITAVVKVGSEKFTSFPNELPTREEAQVFVTELAIESLKKRQSSTCMGTLSANNIVDRVKEIVGSKDNGVVNKAIAEAYKELHQEVLPPNWLDIVDNSSVLTVERFNEKDAIVYPVVEDPSTIKPANLETPNHHASPLQMTTEVVKEISVISDVNGSDDLLTLPALKYPQDEDWDVFVASASQEALWVRLIGSEYDLRYNDAMNDMEVKLMSSNGEDVSNPVINNYYQVKFDNNWSRVQLLEFLPESNEVEVFLIDNGEIDVIKLGELRELDVDLRNVPAQAIKCRLACVDMQVKEVQDFLINNIIGNSFVASVLQRPSEGNEAVIILYDTKSKVAENVNVTLCDMVISGVPVPKLQRDTRAEMFISHVGPESLYVQLKTRHLELLNLILEDINLTDVLIEPGIRAYPSLKQRESPNGEMFIVHSRKDPDHWRRGIIVGAKSHTHLIVHLIDYGYCEVVRISDMFDLEKVFSPLCKFPKQALQVDLDRIPRKDLVGGVVARVRELVPSNLSVLGKVVGDNVVEFFKRVQPDNMIVSISTDLEFKLLELLNASVKVEENDAIEEVRHHPLLLISKSTNETSISTGNGVLVDVQSDARKEDTKRIENSEDKTMEGSETKHLVNGSKKVDSPILSNGELKQFKVPDVGPDFFDVTVTLSPNPFNFFVQPLELLNGPFHDMMNDMQSFYEAHQSEMPLPLHEELNEGAVFAAKHPEDMLWHRVKLIARLNKTLVSVNFLDHGDINFLSLDNLRHLESQFTRVPTLAIRAKLHGVAPKDRDWSVEECIFFNELVSNRCFVSKIMEKNDDTSTHDWEVSLQLYDTTGEEDIDIAQKLIADGLAAAA